MYKIGDVVVSISGRDIGDHYLIKDVTEKGVLLVNGTSRKVDKPKFKNIKHIRKINSENFNIFSNFDLKNFAINAIINKILKKSYSNQGE